MKGKWLEFYVGVLMILGILALFFLALRVSGLSLSSNPFSDHRGQFINLYAAFDVYFVNGRNIRGKKFIPDASDHRERDSLTISFPASVNVCNPLLGSLNTLSVKPFSKRFVYDLIESL